MRRPITGLVVGGVLLLAVLAAADAFRSAAKEKSVPAAGMATRPESAKLSELLGRESVSGSLVYSDEDCILHSLLLPALVDDIIRRESGGPLQRCTFSIGAGRILAKGEVVSPDGSLTARCTGGGIRVWQTESGITDRSLRGCPPVWRPDGRLTYPRGGAILEEGRPLYTTRELRAVARLHPTIASLGAGSRVFTHATDLAWLDEDHLVATLDIRVEGVEPLNLVLLFEGKTAVSVATNRGRGLGNWVVSSQGSYAASEDGTIVLRDGGSVDPPQNLPDARAVAFSPDEQWLAYATGTSVYLVGTPGNGEPGRVIRLPIAAQDLTWEPGGPTIDTTTTAR